MPRIGPLQPGRVSHALQSRLSGRVDRIRQLFTKFGLRSQRVFLVWATSSGAEVGEGWDCFCEIEILPTPKVSDTTSISRSPFSAGTLPVGTIRVSEISNSAYTKDVLKGLRMPKEHPKYIDLPAPNVTFFYEVREDGRGDNPDVRERYRLLGGPYRREGGFEFIVLLERESEDRTRRGQSQQGVDPDVLAAAVQREGLLPA